MSNARAVLGGQAVSWIFVIACRQSGSSGLVKKLFGSYPYQGLTLEHVNIELCKSDLQVGHAAPWKLGRVGPQPTSYFSAAGVSPH